MISSIEKFDIDQPASFSSITRREIRSDGEINRQMRDMVRGSSMISYYIRMSWTNKISFLTNLFKRVNTANTLILLLNTLYSVTGKIASYFKTNTATPMNYDTMLQDHDRMLDEELLQETVENDLAWFGTIEDKDQVAYIIAMTRTLYKRLRQIYTEHVQKIALSNRDSEIKSAERSSGRSRDKLYTFVHNLDDPRHQKCLVLQKQWDKTMDQFRKRVEQLDPCQKSGSGAAGTSEKKSKRSKKKKNKKKSKSKKEKTSSQMDWVQIMPIWVVKKIFGYLDLKTLKKAEKVNKYWKWAIGELRKDRKVRKMLDKTNKKLKDKSGKCTLPDEDIFKSPRRRVGFDEKRWAKLQSRGAIIEELRHIADGALETECLLMNALRTTPDSTPYLNDMDVFPRIIRTQAPTNQKPDCVIKDLGIICEEVDREESASEGSSCYLCSSQSSSNSSFYQFLK